MTMNEIEKLKRHIQLMENRKWVKFDDFSAFCDDRKRWGDSLGSWMRRKVWPLNFRCKECRDLYELHLEDLNNNHVDVTYLNTTGITIACLLVIIECRNCGLENIYNLVEL